MAVHVKSINEALFSSGSIDASFLDVWKKGFFCFCFFFLVKIGVCRSLSNYPLLTYFILECRDTGTEREREREREREGGEEGERAGVRECEREGRRGREGERERERGRKIDIDR